MPPGDMEGMSHTELHALVSGARPKDITSRCTALLDAGSKIEDIARDLLKLVEKAEWKGESGEALRTWTRGFAEQGANLGTYARSVGDALLTAGDGLTQAQSAMPKPKPGGHPSTAEGGEFERQEALLVIDRLTSYYTEATNQATRPEKPNFAPLSTRKDPGPEPAPPSSGGEEATGLSAQQTGVVSTLPVNQGSSSSGAQEQSSTAPGPADRQIQTELDSVGTAPETRTPAPSEPGRPVGGGGGGFNAAGPIPASSTLATPTSRGSAPQGSAARPPVGARPGSSAGIPSPASSPRDATAGTRPGAPGYGIHGGTPRAVNSSPPQARTPQGTVIGGESSATGRGMATGAGTAGFGQGNAASSPANRRLATQQGGVVSAPQGRNGSVSAFTPGGTGLVQRSAPTAAAPTSPNTTDRKRNERKRADFLVEDKETWTQGSRKTLPPVIDS